jgi:hypothetical protein
VDSDSGRAPRHRDAYEQLGVSITQAFVRLRAHAYACNRQLADLARDIVPAGLQRSPGTNFPRRVGRENIPAFYARANRASDGCGRVLLRE